MWLGDVVLRNLVPVKDVVKISFLLEPVAGCGVAGIASDGNNRLNANRMLRARKILGYVAERIEPREDEGEDGGGKDGGGDGEKLRPEEHLELWCLNQVRLS